MKYILLLLFTFSIYPAQTNLSKARHSKRFIPFNVANNSFSQQNHGFYRAFITGDKTKFNKKLINIFKKYGFIHILTPSGIHLSSALVLFRLFSMVELFLIIIIYFYLNHLGSYHSMERVLIFRFIYKILKIIPMKLDRIEISFLVTILLSAILGQFSSNPLSFIYSIAFWGTVLIYREQKLKLILVLNFTLLFISSFNSSGHSPLSLFVNPVVTFILSGVFPIFLLNSILPNAIQINLILNWMVETILSFISIIDFLDPFPLIKFESTALVFPVFFLIKNHFKLFLLSLCLVITPLPNKERMAFSKIAKSQKVINLPDHSEKLKNKNGWIEFVYKKCKIEDIRIVCKEKPSRWGGPIF